MMGVKTIREATEIEFDLKLDDDLFKLPDFKKESIRSIINEQMGGSIGGSDESEVEQASTQEQMDQVTKQLQDGMNNFGEITQR